MYLESLQLKHSDLAVRSYSQMILQKIKISVGFKKAAFGEEKLKIQMEDTRHAVEYIKLRSAGNDIET